MKINSKRTLVDYIDVEIDPRTVLEKIYVHSKPSGLHHLSSDGYWYGISGHDYHKNEELYDKVRLATEEEIEFRKAYLLLRKYVSDNGL